jgi:hypothetical protein
MLGCLWLSDVKPFRNRSDRKRLTKQKVNNLEAAWIGEGSERFKHGQVFHYKNILVKEYYRAARTQEGSNFDEPAINGVVFAGPTRDEAPNSRQTIPLHWTVGPDLSETVPRNSRLRAASFAHK